MGLRSGVAYGRAFGVDWVWLLGMLGFETVWVVLVPTALVELVFPERRDEPWLGARGLASAAVLFVIGAFVAWCGWTRRARPIVYHMAPCQPPLPAMLMGLAIILALIAAAFAPRERGPVQRDSTRQAPDARLVALTAFVAGRAWQAFIPLAYGARSWLPAWVPLLGGFPGPPPSTCWSSAGSPVSDGATRIASLSRSARSSP